MENTKYEARGVSSQKNDVHKAIKKLDKGLFQNTFSKVLPDLVANNPEYANIMHSDGAGTKSIITYIYWKETNDINVWKYIAQDAIVMNLDDILVTANAQNILISQIINRNKLLIPGEVIEKIIEGTIDFCNKMKNYGINITITGGETADVGDLVRTIAIDITAFTRVKKQHIININIKPDDVIVGFASYGQASYEEEYNSGISSNGLTSARHDILNKLIAQKYPESYDPAIEKFAYIGKNLITDIEPETKLTYGKLLLSPTRTYAPLLKQIYNSIDLQKINGIIHNTGGGQTKVLKFAKNVKIIKNNLLPIPPIFKQIMKQTNTPWQEMVQVFNMGHRLEIYTDQKTAEKLIQIAQNFNIQAQIIGHVEHSNKTELIISHNNLTAYFSK